MASSKYVFIWHSYVNRLMFFPLYLSTLPIAPFLKFLCGWNGVYYHFFHGSDRETTALLPQNVDDGHDLRAADGCPWRALPDVFGPLQTVYSRWCLWCDKGFWKRAVQSLDRHLQGKLLKAILIAAQVNDPKIGPELVAGLRG